MNSILKLNTTWQSIPGDVKQFLKRALCIFIIWQLFYNLFLFNGRILDKPLTDWSAIGAQKIMQLFYPGNKMMVKEESSYTAPPVTLFFTDILYMNGKKIVGVADPCNALELYVLYIGFLITFPSTLKRIFLFSFAGILIIYIANIIRLAALAGMYMHQMEAVEIAHHYVFKIIVYSLIFGLWVLFTKKHLKYEKIA